MPRYVETALVGRDSGTMLPFATIDRKAERVVGSTRLGNVQFRNWPAGNPNQRGKHLPDVVEIGWTWLSPDVQRTGINTEAKLLMLNHTFEFLRVHWVSLKTDSQSERSRTAIKRLGAKFNVVIKAAQTGYDGAIRHFAFYSILDSEWLAVKSQPGARLRP